MLTPTQHVQISQVLHRARLARTEVPPICENPELGIPKEAFTNRDAYAIQNLGIQERVNLGEKIIGMKMGLTSEAKRKQMNLSSPIYGVLTGAMQVRESGPAFKVSSGIHPKIEPEIALTLSQDLNRVITLNEALDFVETFFPALEILDSRYRGFKYFSLPDVIADNSSSSHFFVGTPISAQKHVSLSDVVIQMTVNGQTVGSARGVEISGNPLQSLVELSRLCAENGSVARKGFVVLLGAATPAVALEPGMEVGLAISELGACKLKVE